METRTGKINLYDLEGRLATALKRLDSDKELSNKNKELIRNYHRYCFTKGLSVSRALFFVIRLRKMAKWLGVDFDKATKKDLEELILRIVKEKCAERSKYDLKTAIKQFYKWVKGTEEYPDIVKWIKVRDVSNHKLPEELLTVSDIKNMIDTADTPRDKALISMLYESGCRIGEIGTLRLKNVNFDKYGAVLIVDGKTGMRRVRLITSVHYLTSWLENHPLKDNPAAPLWVSIGNGKKGKAMRYDNIRMVVQRVSDKAGIKKRANLHTFRHSRATHLANKLTEAQMKEHFGWVQASKMASIYVHLSGRDVDKAILQIHGIIQKDEQEDYILCPRCDIENKAEARFCESCGMPLNMKALVEIEDKRDKLEGKLEPIMDVLKDTEVQELIAQKLAEHSK